MLNSPVAAHQGDDEAIVRFEDEAVLRQVDGDTVVIQDVNRWHRIQHPM